MKVTHLQLEKALFVPNALRGGKTFDRTVTPERYPGIEMTLDATGGVHVKYERTRFYIPAGSYECAILAEEVKDASKAAKKS